MKEIKYFAGLNLISTSDVMYLKNELQQLLTDLEHLSIKGEFNEGHELYIYLSNIDFEATYSYVSRKDGLTKSPNLPDTKKLDTVFEKALHTDFGKWRGTEDCVY